MHHHQSDTAVQIAFHRLTLYRISYFAFVASVFDYVQKHVVRNALLITCNPSLGYHFERKMMLMLYWERTAVVFCLRRSLFFCLPKTVYTSV